jgi:hypothetical protein
MRFSVFAALVLAASAATAQNPRKVAFRTLALEHAGDMTELSLPPGKDGEAPVAVPLYTASISQVFETVFPAGKAVLFAKGGAAGEAPVVAAEGALAKSDRQLFILIPVAKPAAGKPAYQLRAYDDDTTTFKLGSIRAINLAPVNVRFLVSGARTPEIPSQRYAIFPHATKVDEYNMYQVAAEFRSGSGEWVKGYSASWKATDRRREIVVTLVDGKFKQPVVKVFSDEPPWVEIP